MLILLVYLPLQKRLNYLQLKLFYEMMSSNYETKGFFKTFNKTLVETLDELEDFVRNTINAETHFLQELITIVNTSLSQLVKYPHL